MQAGVFSTIIRIDRASWIFPRHPGSKLLPRANWTFIDTRELLISRTHLYGELAR